MKKNEELCWMVKRKDEVEEVEEAGLVNKQIFWRSVGGNVSEGQGYEFMTEYDTMVTSIHGSWKYTCPPYELGSGFWIDEFIETTWLAVAFRFPPFLDLYHISSRRERKKSKYTTLFFFSKIKTHTENRYVD